MSNDTEFAKGIIVKPPREGAPEYVKAKISIKREEFIAWLQSVEGDWVNLDVKESQGGKWYAAVDKWKPQGGSARGPQSAPAAAQDFEDDSSIPF